MEKHYKSVFRELSNRFVYYALFSLLFGVCIVLLHSGCEKNRALLEVSSDGVYGAGHMYWYHPVLFTTTSEFIVLCEVVEVGEPYQAPEEHQTWVDGTLKLEKIVRCKPELQSIAKKISYIKTDGCNDVNVGDRVIVFMVEYEGGYDIPCWYSTNCDIGHKLPKYSWDEGRDENNFLELLSKDYAWDITKMSPEELRLWTHVDAYGLAHAFISAREYGQDY
jgi:hypothetical protein